MPRSAMLHFRPGYVTYSSIVNLSDFPLLFTKGLLVSHMTMHRYG